jgi:hypothetical protein
MSEAEALKYIEVKTGRLISRFSFQKLKKQLHEDPDRNAWLSYYAKSGFVDFYRNRLREMELIQTDLMRMWVIENNKHDKTMRDKQLILQLDREIRGNEVVLCQLGVSMPFIANMKAAIDGNKDNEKAKQLLDNVVSYSEYQSDNKTSSDGLT